MTQEGATVSVGSDGSMSAEAGRRGAGIVVLAGMLTTALALAAVWWLDNNTTDFNIMGWYADYILPVGALLVGAAAGSGYGVASYLTGFRIRRGLLLTVLALQLTGYAAAQYLEFRTLTREGPLIDAEGQTLTFARFYHLRAVSFAWKDRHSDGSGKPLGSWCYFFVGLGVLGFVAGGVIAPAILMKKPYCERCELYMRSRTLALVPASIRHRRVSKRDADAQAAYAKEQEQAASAAGDVLSKVGALAGRGDAHGIKSALASYPARGGYARRAGRLPTRLRVGLVHCRQCSAGYLQPAMITGQGRGIRVRALDRMAMPDGTARAIADE